MKDIDYIRITNFFKKTKRREIISKAMCKYLPLSTALVYLISIVYLFVQKDTKLILFTLVPAITFIFVTILRKILNKPRPYDELNFTPLLNFKKGKGKSFPSRHTSSAFIIAIACFYINSYFGIAMFVLAVLIGITRIIGGLHYPKDVIFAIILSFIFGSIFFI